MTDSVEDKGQARLPGVYGNLDLGSRITMFQEKADSHKEKQKLNPFSGSFDAVASAKQKLNKEDPNYGKPVEGSKTEKRGKHAAQLLANEIKMLCSFIKQYGKEQEDGSVGITFGELFQLYKGISNKVVGLLIRARKHGLVKFEGEMLFQSRDDHVFITLIREPNESDNFAPDFPKQASISNDDI